MKPVLEIKRAKVAVELTSRCNLRCAMCPMHNLGRPLMDMPLPLVEKVAEDFRTNGLTVSWLHEMGDPLLYPHLAKAIDLFPGASLSTNVMLLDQAKGEEILATSLQRIRLCIDTINPQLYPTIRKGGVFERVVANTRTFLELSKGSRIKVEIQRMITTETADESVAGFARFFSLEKYPQAEVIEKTCEPLDTNDETSFHQSYYGCFQGYPFRWFIVLADGRVTHCCYDAHGTQIIGDMNTQTVREIVESATLPRYMAAFKGRDWQTLPRCGECYKHAEGKPPFYDSMIRLGYALDRYVPIKKLARRLINR